ncbi:MAG: hypothetical protein E6Q71_01270 [Pseudomonas sp.]|nr:MAG: hypothetical protein E6Q71_01270 [Pseudomonas sp.]
MANGQQIAEQNHAAFLAWASSKSDDDFREYVHRGKLKRAEIASECGFGKSALVQNPAIRNALEALEDALRSRGVLPSLTVPAELPERDREARQRRQDSQRLNSLEQENAALRAELTQAKAMLDRYKLMAAFMEETGRLPR